MREMEMKSKLKAVSENEWKHPPNQGNNRSVCYCPKLQPDDFGMDLSKITLSIEVLLSEFVSAQHH